MEDIEHKSQEIGQKEIKQKHKILSSGWYDKNYKKLLIVEIILFVLALGYLGYFYSINGDIMYKDTTLTGGTAISLYTDNISVSELSNYLSNKLVSGFNVRTLEDTYSRKIIAVVIESKEDVEILKPIIEEYLGYSLNTENSGIEVTSSSLSQSFYNDLLRAIILAFLFMAIVVFIIFKAPIPSLAVIHAAAADIIFTIAFANLISFKIGTAGIAALLMLIGYSVDTDILLTTRVLKRKGEGTVNSRIKYSFKTGLMMNLTAIIAVTIGYFVSVAPTLKEIFFILAVGIFFDIVATWIGNASMIKWYCDKKKID